MQKTTKRIEKLNELIENKLINAEKQIDEGKTINANEVFKELKEQFGY